MEQQSASQSSWPTLLLRLKERRGLVDSLVCWITYWLKGTQPRRVEVVVQACGWNPESEDLIKLCSEAVWDAWNFVLKESWEAVEGVNPRFDNLEQNEACYV
jgi:hypothetical protein